MQLALTADQVKGLERSGVEKIQKLLDENRIGSYRRPFVEQWLEQAMEQAVEAETPEPEETETAAETEVPQE